MQEVASVGNEGMEEQATEAAAAMVVAESRDDSRKKQEISYNNINMNEHVCPICLDSFSIPCRSNCGHFFCAGCILQLWMYRYSIQACKCPMCCCRIVNLELQTTSHLTTINPVQKEVQRYNALYISPLFAFAIVPLVMGRILRVMVDLDSLKCIYYVMRLIGLFLGLIYEHLEFEFLPTGGLGIQRTFDLIASMLVAALFLVGIMYGWMLKRRRTRLLALVDT